MVPICQVIRQTCNHGRHRCQQQAGDSSLLSNQYCFRDKITFNFVMFKRFDQLIPAASNLPFYLFTRGDLSVLELGIAIPVVESKITIACGQV